MTHVDETTRPASDQRVEAYVDEAGAKGFLRNLNASDDDKIAVIAAIAIPQTNRERFRDPFVGPFVRFKAARPTGNSSLHITDAFGSGDQGWALAARTSRDEIISVIQKLQIPVVYDARRLRVARESFHHLQGISDEVRAQRRSNVGINWRPSAERVEGECMIGLALKLDCLAQDFGFGLIDIMTDQLDTAIAEVFVAMLDRTRMAGEPKERVTTGWDRDRKERVYGSIRSSITDTSGEPLDWLAAKHLGDIVVLGKDDPLVFAADVVVNALHHHLCGLAKNAALNHPASIEGWVLAGRVYGVRDDAIEDKI